MNQDDEAASTAARHALLQDLELPFDRARCEEALARIKGMEWPDAELDRLLQDLASQATGCQPDPSDDDWDPLFVEVLAMMGAVLLRQLARTDLDDDERAYAVDVAEIYVDFTHGRFTDVPKLVAPLMAQAVFLRDHMPTGHEETLVKALTTVATIAEYDVVPGMMGFLRPCDAPNIKLPALLALHILFSGDPPDQGHPRLWERLHELLEAYGREELVRMSEEICQLAISTLVAAAASGAPWLLEHASKIGLLWPPDQERLTHGLREMHDHWHEHRSADDPAMTNLERLLAGLA